MLKVGHVVVSLRNVEGWSCSSLLLRNVEGWSCSNLAVKKC